ncbi:hypothetical protein Tco_1318740 [Tanacetum coccineum]
MTLNVQFVYSPKWNTYVVVWRNKPDLDTMIFDDLYNNFKIVEQEVKRTATSSTSSSSQNMAFVSSPSSTNEVKTANVQVSTANSSVSTDSTLDSTANLSDATVYAFLANQPNGSQLVHEDLEQIHEDDIEEMDLKWQLALLSMRARRYYQRTGKKITINGSDTAGMTSPRNQDSSRRTVNVEETSSKAMVAIDGAGFDWSFMADEEVTTNMALMAFSDSKVYNEKTFSNTCLKSFEATYKRGLASIEEKLVFYKKNEVIFSDQIVVLKRDTSFKDSKINVLKSEIEKLKKEKESNQIKIDKFENDSKCLDKLIGSLISDNNRKGVGFVSYNVILPPPIGLFAPLTIDLSNSGLEEFQHAKFKGNGPKAKKEKQTIFPTKIEFVKQQDKTARKPVKYAEMYRSQKPRGNQRNWNNLKSQQLGSDFVMYNKACFVCGSFDHFKHIVKYHKGKRSGIRTVNTALPKSIVFSAKPMSRFSKSAQSTVKRPYQSKTVLTNKNFSQKVNTAKAQAVNTARPKAVNTARPNSAVVNTDKQIEYLMLNASPLKHVKRGQDTKIPQSSGPPVKVGDEAIHKELCDKMERAATTTSSLEVEHDSEQFWQTVALSTIEDGVLEITATIDGRVKTITEASIRRHLNLEDYDDEKSLQGIFWGEHFIVSNNASSGSGVYLLGNDEDSLSLNELTVLCNLLSKKVESLESDLKQTKQTYSTALTKLIKRVKQTIKTSQARRRAKVVISNAEEDEEDPSKQGRSLIEELDMDAGISLVPPHVGDQGRFDNTHVSDQPKEQLGVFSTTKVLADAAKQKRDVENVQTYTRRRRAVSTGSGEVSTASELVSTTSVKAKDKGKAVMQESEPPKKIKKRVQEAKFKAEQEQERLDHETAMKIQEELDAIERQRMAQVHQAAQGFTDDERDDILARVAADKDFVQQLQAGEKVSDEDLPRKLVELVNQRKKFFAQQRAKARRNKPMTSAQQKEYMSTYIKNQEGGYTLKQLKALSFEEVKEIFETTMRKVQSFVPMVSKLELQRLKRAGHDVVEEPTKRQRTGEASGSVQEQTSKELKVEELSQEQLHQMMMVILVEEVYIEALQVKYPIIDWEIYFKDSRKYWKNIRVGGHTEAYQTFDDMLKKFDRDDLDKLWNLVKESITPCVFKSLTTSINLLFVFSVVRVCL